MELQEFVEVHYVSLFRTAFLLTGDRHSAEDLLQDALTKSWAFAQRTSIEQPGAFLRRCMVNQYLSQWRRRRLVREEPTDEANMPERTVADGSVIRPAFSGQFQTAIYAAALRSRYSLWTSCGVR